MIQPMLEAELDGRDLRLWRRHRAAALRLITRGVFTASQAAGDLGTWVRRGVIFSTPIICISGITQERPRYDDLKKGCLETILRENFHSQLRRAWETGDKFTRAVIGKAGSLRNGLPYRVSGRGGCN